MSLIQLLAQVPGKQQKTAQILRPRPSTWETWVELWALGFGLVQLWPLWPFGA